MRRLYIFAESFPTVGFDEEEMEFKGKYDGDFAVAA